MRISPAFAALALCAVSLTAGGFAALWWGAVTRADDAVTEVCIGTAEYPDWFLAEKRVEGAAYYTVYSRGGATAWDGRFGNRPCGWLYGGAAPNAVFLLQRVDGSTWALNLAGGDYGEVPAPDTPLLPLGAFFAAAAESADDSR